jgi:CarD family transcriptional regulator
VQFETGDVVVHPHYGAAVVTEIRERQFLDVQEKSYYSLQLLGHPETTVMVALENAEEAGLRPAVGPSKLKRVWRVLRSEPSTLPKDHNRRYQVLKEKLQSGSILRIAEVIRDLASRHRARRKWTTRGKRQYDRGMELLASEIAGAKNEDLEVAQHEIVDTLSEGAPA